MSLISRMRRQRAVWWKAVGLDEFGQPVFDEPVEIACRWESKAMTFIDTEGKEAVSDALVYVDRNMSVKGDRLWRGKLKELEGETDPHKVQDTFPVRHFGTLPNIRATENLLTAYL